MTGFNHQLFLRTSPDNLQEIRKILNNIDRPIRRIIIHVRQSTDGAHRLDGISTEAQIRSGDNSEIAPRRSHSGISITSHGFRHNSRSDLSQTYRVQALEGRPVFIATGQSIPGEEWGYGIAPFPYYRNSTGYRDTASGFYALARLNGEQVTIEISAQSEQTSTGSAPFDVRQTITSLSGRLGEWISLGGVNQLTGFSSRGTAFRIGTQDPHAYSLSLMVDLVR